MHNHWGCLIPLGPWFKFLNYMVKMNAKRIKLRTTLIYHSFLMILVKRALEKCDNLPWYEKRYKQGMKKHRKGNEIELCIQLKGKKGKTIITKQCDC